VKRLKQSLLSHIKHEKIFGSIPLNLKGKKLVCKKFLMNLYQISEKRVKTVEKKIIEGSIFLWNSSNLCGSNLSFRNILSKIFCCLILSLIICNDFHEKNFLVPLLTLMFLCFNTLPVNLETRIAKNFYRTQWDLSNGTHFVRD
jgi:hypothetical protein